MNLGRDIGLQRVLIYDTLSNILSRSIMHNKTMKKTKKEIEIENDIKELITSDKYDKYEVGMLLDILIHIIESEVTKWRYS